MQDDSTKIVKQIVTRMTPELFEEIKQVAKEEHRSVNNQVIIWIEKGLAERKRQAKGNK